MQDLVAGRIDYLCIDTPVAIPLIESGQIKALAILTRARSASLPNLPSAQEQGLADFEAANWAAFFMPKGTPAPIVEKLAAASAAAIGSTAVQKRMKESASIRSRRSAARRNIWRRSSRPRSPNGPARSRPADWRRI